MPNNIFALPSTYTVVAKDNDGQPWNPITLSVDEITDRQAIALARAALRDLLLPFGEVRDGRGRLVYTLDATRGDRDPNRSSVGRRGH